ncbi:MAG TPA: NAD(P)-dependent oxidoreductase [Balneolales bacterium]|nr:NAD(P)-dependent oxidoreductase [Balneolales bacterium]
MKIGFLGLGNMGEPMARNLLKSGDYELTVYNRTQSKTEKLKNEGADVADSVEDLVSGKDVVITMLSDDFALLSVMYDEGGLDAMDEDTIHISMSTISTELSRELDEVHDEEGSFFVSAPVFGRPDFAADGKLWIVAAGDSDAVEKCKPLFDIMGRETSVVGDEAYKANLVKVAGNFMIASMIESLGESFALIKKSGMDIKEYLEIINGALFNSPIYKNYGSLIADESYTPAGFKMKHGLKDVSLALETANASEVPMPLASLMHDHYLSGIAKGWSEYDWAALAKVSAEMAGIKE